MKLWRNPHHGTEWIALVAVLWIAAFLRFDAPTIVEFKRDEAVLSRLAMDVASGDHFTWLGMGSSTGFPNTPISVYLFAIPYAISNNPLIANLFVGFLNVIAVALVWKMARRYGGPWAGFVAAFLYAVSPWAVIYSRKIWAQDILAPFIVLTVFTAMLGFVEVKPKRWAQFWHLPFLALTAQIHFAGAVLVPVTLVALWCGRKQLKREFWLSAGVMILLALPFVYGLYDADLLNRPAIENALNKEDAAKADPAIESTALEYAWFSVNGTNIHSLTGAEAFRDYLATLPSGTYSLFRFMFILGSLAGLLWLGRNFADQRGLALILLAWLVVPIVAFTYTWTPIQPHYLIPMMSAAYVLIGLGMGLGVNYPQQRLPYTNQLAKALVVVVVAIGLLQGLATMKLWDFVEVNPTLGAFGTPLKYQLQARQVILAEKPSDVLVLAQTDSIAFDQEPAVWDVLLDDIASVRFVNSRRLDVIAEDEAFYLAMADVNRAGWKSPDNRIELRPTEGQLSIWASAPYSLPPHLTPTHARFANGVILEGVQPTTEGLVLVWRVPSSGPSVLFTAYVHVMDAQEQRIGQVDIPFWLADYWRDGDRVVMPMPLDLNGAASLRIGMYLNQNGVLTASEHLDAQGRYVEQFFPLSSDDLLTTPN